MQEFKRVIVGYGGHAYVLLDCSLANHIPVHYYTEIRKSSNNPFKLEYLGYENENSFKGFDLNLRYILGLGNNYLREKSGQLLLKNNEIIENVISQKTYISSLSEIGLGVYIAPKSIINAFSKIENFVILNSGCIVEHGCNVGQASHIAPGAILLGNVKIGKRSFIGANSIIKEGVVIGDDVTIGAGSVVLNDVKSNSKIVGNPGRIINEV